MKIRILAIGIVLFWFLMTYTLVRDRIMPYWLTFNSQTLPTVSLTRGWNDIEVFDTITYHGQPKGQSALSITRTEDRTYDVRNAIEFELRLFNAYRKVEWKSRLMLDENFTLTKFISRIWVDNLNLEITGFTAEDTLYYKLLVGGHSAQYGAFPLSQPISLMEAVGPTIFKSQRLRVGEVYTIPVFDPLWQMEGGEMTMSIVDKESIWHGDEKIEVFRIETQFGSLNSTMWVTEDGQVVRRQIIDLLDLIRITEQSEIRKLRRMLRPLAFPEYDLEEYREGAKNYTISVEAGIADILKGNFNLNNDRTE